MYIVVVGVGISNNDHNTYKQRKHMDIRFREGLLYTALVIAKSGVLSFCFLKDKYDSLIYCQKYHWYSYHNKTTTASQCHWHNKAVVTRKKNACQHRS